LSTITMLPGLSSGTTIDAFDGAPRGQSARPCRRMRLCPTTGVAGGSSGLSPSNVDNAAVWRYTTGLASVFSHPTTTLGLPIRYLKASFPDHLWWIRASAERHHALAERSPSDPALAIGRTPPGQQGRGSPERNQFAVLWTTISPSVTGPVP
jgi:hypothetical protein